MAAHYWVEAVGQDVDRRMKEDKEERLQNELDRFMENAVGYSKPSNTWI
jgi:hypothetical protein